MNIVDLSIKRPVFITCVFILSIVIGLMSFFRINVDLFPDVTFPVVAVSTTYEGSGPKEIENLITKPIEDAVSSVGGIESIKSVSQDNQSSVIVTFILGTDIRYAQQQIKDKISLIRNGLPDDLLNEPVVEVFDPNDNPIIYLAIAANMDENDLYDFAEQKLKPMLDGVSGVGRIDISGAEKREIHVLLDREKLKNNELSIAEVSQALRSYGKNIPGGNFKLEDKNANIRTIGEYNKVSEISDVAVRFYGNESLRKVADLGKVLESNEDETSKTFFNGKKTLLFEIYKNSDANTVSVAENVKKKIDEARNKFSNINDLELKITKDDSKRIKDNLYDVGESIIIGLILTIICVYLFLGNFRSTLITAIALPNSLICGFILMYYADFTMNILTLLALSLSVGLLVDDAIVVRENIFRNMELGKNPMDAARIGTKEIIIAVTATTFVIIGVFLPIAYLQGVVGQFFKQFGFTVCFIMMISLVDAVTMAPMLSAYFGGIKKNKSIFSYIDDGMQILSNKLNNFLVTKYEKIIKISLKHYILTLLIVIIFTIGGFATISSIPKTFRKNPDNGEFTASIELEQGIKIEETYGISKKIDEEIRKRKDVDYTLLNVGGGTNAKSNTASIFVKLTPQEQRNLSTTEVRSEVRKMIEKYNNIKSFGVTDRDSGGGHSSKNTGAFTLEVSGLNQEVIQKVVDNLVKKLEKHPDLQDIDTSYREGRPELGISINDNLSNLFGITKSSIGNEIRRSIDGEIAGTYKENGYDYNIRVRLKEDQRNLVKQFEQFTAPNINNRIINIANVASTKLTKSPSSIYRSDKMNYIAITASENSNGPGGLSKAIEDTKELLKEEIKNNPEISYKFEGQAKRFEELGRSIMIAMLLAVVFMYLVLASLYESFVQPFMIMIVLPLALCGGFYALFIMHETLDLFSMIGFVMLMGVSAKNSILLVDCINNFRKDGMDKINSIVEAGKQRIRPILMTSLVLISGMIPVAIGLNEASSQRTSMGVVIVGGMISSTFLTLIAIPAIYILIENIKRILINIKNKFS